MQEFRFDDPVELVVSLRGGGVCFPWNRREASHLVWSWYEFRNLIYKNDERAEKARKFLEGETFTLSYQTEGEMVTHIAFAWSEVIAMQVRPLHDELLRKFIENTNRRLNQGEEWRGEDEG